MYTPPTLINLPPPPSDPATPSEMGPGTPNSTTTSMSELSTVAIKDGHRGHPHHHHANPLHPSSTAVSSTTLDAERADRISRLAGLERVSTLRSNSQQGHVPTGASPAQTPGYFDSSAAPQQHIMKERSTVGSASATGSVGGRTTWASESDVYDPTDKMSEDQEMETSSAGGFSDEGSASLVGFGEGAGSTVSGPVSALPGARTPQLQSVNMAGAVPNSPQLPGARPGSLNPYLRGSNEVRPPGSGDSRYMDGVSYDSAGPDPSTAAPLRGFNRHVGGSGGGAESAEYIAKDSFDGNSGGTTRHGERKDGPREMGKYSFDGSR